MMEAAGQVLDAIGQSVLDAITRGWTGLEDSSGEKTKTDGYTQGRHRMIGDISLPIQCLLKAVTQPVYGIRNRFAPGCDVLTNLFRAAFNTRNLLLFLPALS